MPRPSSCRRRGDDDRHRYQPSRRSWIGAADRWQGPLRGARHKSREADGKRIIDEVLAREGALTGWSATLASRTFPATRDRDAGAVAAACRSTSRGVFLGCKYGAYRRCQSGGGRLDRSICRWRPSSGTPDLSAYGASKGAVRQFTKTVAIDCARWLQGALQLGPSRRDPDPDGRGHPADRKGASGPRQRIPIGVFGARGYRLMASFT